MFEISNEKLRCQAMVTVSAPLTERGVLTKCCASRVLANEKLNCGEPWKACLTQECSNWTCEDESLPESVLLSLVSDSFDYASLDGRYRRLVESSNAF